MNLPSSKLNGSISGEIVELFVRSECDVTKSVPLQISKEDLQWVQVLSEGWASPLRGFMNEDQYLQCLHFNRLKINKADVNQSIPIVLPIDDDQKTSIQGEPIKYCSKIYLSSIF